MLRACVLTVSVETSRLWQVKRQDKRSTLPFNFSLLPFAEASMRHGLSKMAGMALGVALIVGTVQPASAETARYDVDPDHSSVGFSVDHMVVSKTRGQFMEYTGFIEMDPDAKT